MAAVEYETIDATDAVDEYDLPIFEFADGRRFIPGGRVHPGGSPFQSADGEPWDEDDLRAFCSALWHDAFDARRAEIERLKLNSLYYDGFHYSNAFQNRQNAIANRIYSAVEAQVALAVAAVPRPEIVPRGWEDPGRVERLQLAAEFIEDLADYDHAIYLGARDKFIYGYNIWLISFDAATGMPFVKNVSVFDYYPGPDGRDEFECSYHVFGFCVSTHRLRASFPDVAHLIEPDLVASPSYDVTEIPWMEFTENATVGSSPFTPDSALAIHREGETPAGTTTLVADTGRNREHGATTYALQFLIEDRALVPVKYVGTWEDANGVQTVGEYENPEPRCPSGWWVVSYTATNQMLHAPYALDPCYMGLPFVIDRNQQRVDRFVSRSETDHAIPIQRGMNRRKMLLMRGLELAANPPVVATSGHGMQADKGTVAGGEILTINRGSDVRFLEYRGPNQQHFEMNASDSEDMRNVTGVPDVQVGATPQGVQAAAAIRRLDDNSMRRMNGKENPAHRARSLLLRKVMYCAGKKLQGPLMFSHRSGATVAVAGEELCSQFHVRYAKGTGTPDGTRDMQDTAMMLYDKGIVDEEAVLDAYAYPGRKQIAERVRIRREMEMQAQAEAAAMAGANKSPGAKVPVGA